MELRHLRYFIAVAEELHFGRAARRLHVSQPPLSTQIRDLEDELDVKLFDRSPRTVELTEAGRTFLERLRPVFTDLERAVAAVRRAGRGEIGSLSVGHVSTATYSRVPEILRAFHTRFPHVVLSVRKGAPSELIEALLQGDMDVAVLRGPIEEPALAIETIAEEPILAALPATHPLAKRPWLDLGELRMEDFVLPARSRGPGYYDRTLALCHEAGFSPRVVERATDMDLFDILTYVSIGMGVALLPASTRQLHSKQVAFVPLRGRPTSTVALAWRPADPSPALRAFLTLVRRRGIGLE